MCRRPLRRSSGMEWYSRRTRRILWAAAGGLVSFASVKTSKYWQFFSNRFLVLRLKYSALAGNYKRDSVSCSRTDSQITSNSVSESSSLHVRSRIFVIQRFVLQAFHTMSVHIGCVVQRYDSCFGCRRSRVQTPARPFFILCQSHVCSCAFF